MEEFYGDAGRGIKKGLVREQRKHKERTSQNGVRYNTLRAGESLVVRMALLQVPKPSKRSKHAKKGGK